MNHPADARPVDPETPDPVKNPADDPRLRRILADACQQRGLHVTGARPVHRYNNPIYLLPAEHAVARLTGASSTAASIEVTQRFASWVAAEHGVAATAPLPGTTPVTVDDVTIGFWAYYPQPAGFAPTSAQLARQLHALHRAASAPVELPRWVPLGSLTTAVTEPAATLALTDDERTWLTATIEQIRAEVRGLDWALDSGPIHGDAWAGNLLRDTAAGPDSVVLGDWDNVCLGPREVDLIPSWHAALRYGRGQRWAEAFAEIYGYDLATWPGFDVLLRMRDLVQLTGPLRRAATEPTLAQGLRQRFTAIRDNDRTTVWRAY